MAAIAPFPPAPRDPDRDAATITRLRKEVADLKSAALTPPAQNPVMIDIAEVLYFMCMTKPEPTAEKVFSWLLDKLP